ncbi:MAG: hypothetical protein ACREKH_05615, partial [Candidatus Rokuibacteriota bacterium]
MVDGLDVWCERQLHVAHGKHLPREPGDRARRRRAPGARGTFGKQLGKALVQPDQGVAQPIGGEDLEPPAETLRVDLDEKDILPL